MREIRGSTYDRKSHPRIEQIRTAVREIRGSSYDPLLGIYYYLTCQLLLLQSLGFSMFTLITTSGSVYFLLCFLLLVRSFPVRNVLKRFEKFFGRLSSFLRKRFTFSSSVVLCAGYSGINPSIARSTCNKQSGGSDALLGDELIRHLSRFT